MERYKIIKDVGEGTFGSVCQALDTQTGEIVAIKRMKQKYHSLEECLNLPEVKSLRKMKKHKNIDQFPQLPGVYDLKMLMPSASDAAITQEALQHPFFRPCYYIPPSLRSRTSVGTAKSVPLPGRTIQELTPRTEQVITVSRKYSTDEQSQSKIYRQAPRNNPIMPLFNGKNPEGIIDRWDKLAELQVMSSRKGIVPPRQNQATYTAPPPPPYMKTGGWHGSTTFTPAAAPLHTGGWHGSNIFNGHLGRLPHGNFSVTGGRLGDEIYRY
ncbi:hypothetical protein MKX03_027832 [Papaver bracteatum]|nr:hypothetical protein MKX03_027832 [Papaver bracteatum]